MNRLDPTTNTSFKFGFGFFETMRAIKSEIIFFEEHINRLNSSLEHFGLEKVESQTLRKKILNGIKKKNLIDARIRITYSLQNDKPFITYEILPFLSNIPEKAKLKISSIRLKHNDELRNHKTTNYFLNFFEFRLAKSLGYDEVIFLDHLGHILEGSRTNIFLVNYKKNFKDLEVFTPSIKCGVLPGIAREKVIEICKSLKIHIKISQIPYKTLFKVKEIFLTNSLYGIIPVEASIPGFKNEITKQIKKYFDKYFEV